MSASTVTREEQLESQLAEANKTIEMLTEKLNKYKNLKAHREWNQAHKEQIAEQKKEYAKKNREKINEYARNYYHRKKAEAAATANAQ